MKKAPISKKIYTASLCFLLIYSFGISILMSRYWDTPFFSVAFPMFLSAFACSAYVAKYRKMTFIFLAILIYCGMSLVMLIEVKNSFIPLMGVDWKGFTQRAIDNLNSGKKGLALLLTNITNDLFAKVISVIFQIFGIYPGTVHCFIFFFSQLTLSCFFNLSLVLFHDIKRAQVCTFALSITPVYEIHSIAILREIPIAFLFSLSLICFFRYLKEGNALAFLTAILWSAVSAIFHSAMIVVPLFYTASLLFYLRKRKRIVFNVGNSITVILIFFLLFASPLGDLMMIKFSQHDVLTTINNHITPDATTAYISEVPRSYSAMVLQTPYRFLLFELVPLPWHIRSIGTAISWVLDGTLRIFIIIRITILSFKIKKLDLAIEQRVFLYICLAIWFGFGILCGWGTTTYGTAIRHRVKVLPIEWLLVMFSWRYSDEESLYQWNHE